MAATRLRRTFKYPADDDDIPKDLDEEGDYSWDRVGWLQTDAGI